MDLNATLHPDADPDARESAMEKCPRLSPEDVRGVVGVKAVDSAAGGGLWRKPVVAAVRQVGDIDVERRAQEHRTHVLQVGCTRPKPAQETLIS